MSAFPVICGVILIIFIGIFLSKANKKKEIKPEVVINNKDERPVLIELIPKGTKTNPVKCKVGDTIHFKVFGYSDYKKEHLVVLEDTNISWCKSCPVGIWQKKLGVENIYTAPNTKGYRDVWIQYRDSKLVTSSSCKILVEV